MRIIRIHSLRIHKVQVPNSKRDPNLERIDQEMLPLTARLDKENKNISETEKVTRTVGY